MIKRANPNSSPWSKLSEGEKRSLYERYQRGEEVKVKGMKPGTLKRRLREWASQGSAREQIKVDERDPNHVEISANVDSNRITTVEQLLTYCKIDTNVWAIERAIVNKWESGRKHEEKNLVFDEGKITGSIRDYGDTNPGQLIQIKVWLVRKKPVAVKPTIQPVIFNFKAHTPSHKAALGDVDVSLVIPDIHFGFGYADRYRRRLSTFHDREALGIVLKIAASYSFKNIIFLGDNLDFADGSDKFIRSPEFRYLTQPALIECAWWLSKFRQYNPHSTMYYLEGNHEKRLIHSIINNMDWAYNLRGAFTGDTPVLSVPFLLGLDNLNIQWVGEYPDGEVWIDNNTRAIHGSTTGAPGSVASKIVKDEVDNVIFGHIHRVEVASKTIYSKQGAKEIFAISPGFLGKLDGSVPGRTARQAWQQGFLVAYSHRSTSSFVPVSIHEGTAIFDGKLWESNEREVVGEVLKDVPNAKEWGII